jgi:hypothetical protein
MLKGMDSVPALDALYKAARILCLVHKVHTVLARSGTGYLLTFDGLVDTGADSKLCFRPLKPALTTAMYVVWRKHQQFTKAGELFLNEIRAKL